MNYKSPGERRRAEELAVNNAAEEAAKNKLSDNLAVRKRIARLREVGNPGSIHVEKLEVVTGFFQKRVHADNLVTINNRYYRVREVVQGWIVPRAVLNNYQGARDFPQDTYYDALLTNDELITTGPDLHREVISGVISRSSFTDIEALGIGRISLDRGFEQINWDKIQKHLGNLLTGIDPITLPTGFTLHKRDQY